MSDPIKRGPGRPAKVKAERRRKRGDVNALTGTRLAVDKSQLDPNYHYRWINDDPGRVHQMTNLDDYEIVDDPNVKPDASHEGSQVSQIVGSSTDGRGKKAYLVRKKKEYYDDDQAEKQEKLDKDTADMLRGKSGEPETASMDGHAYVPDSGIQYRP